MDKNELQEFINVNISDLNQNRFDYLNKLKLTDILKRENIYLYKAKNIQTSEGLIKTLINSDLMSHEENILVEFWGKLAIFASQVGIYSIDLEIIDNKIRYSEDFNKEYSKVINKFNREFLNTYFLEDGSIDWIKILKLNSENKLSI
ncbi:MAG: hypothetical protein FWF92_05750 [Oscillospiraceae bacterium]|nr:hypothetical protein [Oscillospiraceae bacterium]